MNYSKSKHTFEKRHFRDGGGGTCYSPPRRIAPKPSVSGIACGVVGMHQAMVWAKASHHHGASGITFSSATGVIFFTQKVS